MMFNKKSVSDYRKESKAITNKTIAKMWEGKTQEEKLELKRQGYIQNKYEEKAGSLTFAERKVNLESIERSFDSLEAEFMKEAGILTNAQKSKVMKALNIAIKRKNIQALKDIKYVFNGKLAKEYANLMKNTFEIGKKTASDEMTVKVPATSRDVSGLLRAQAIVMEEKIASEIENLVREESLYGVNKGLTDATIIKNVDKAMDNKLKKILNSSMSQALGGAFNSGRQTVFEKFPDRIYGFQYTAVLDNRTTLLCQSLNGRVVGKNDPDFYSFNPPNHTRCFTKGHKIEMFNGKQKNIENIKIGDFVKTHKLNKGEVYDVLINEVEEEIYEIETESGIILEVTKDHPFLVGNKWIKTKDLKEGNNLVRFKSS